MEAMTLSVSTSRTATLSPSAAGASLEASGPDTATDGAPAEVAAIELMRKWRLFIGDLHFGSGLAISIYNVKTQIHRR
jgi:hypothetical protein